MRKRAFYFITLVVFTGILSSCGTGGAAPPSTSPSTPAAGTRVSPVIQLGVSPTSGTAPLTVNATTAGSTSSSGSITASTIDFGDGTVISTTSGSHTYNSAGTFTVKGTVTNDSGLSASTTATVTVTAAANKAPVAKITVTPTSGTAPVAVTANGAGSSDADGTIAATSINFGDGTVINAASGSHTYNSAGTYTVTITVTDNGGLSASASASVTVSAPGTPPGNQPPVAYLSVTPTSGTAPVTVNASTAGTSDPDGTIAGTSINFGDGTVVNAASASHTYSAAGTYTVKATVTDNGGASSSATATVTVSAPANQYPVAQLSVTPTSGTAPLTVNASTAGSSDPDGTIAGISINFGDGTVLQAASGSHTYSTAGTYTVTAAVTDNGGLSSSKTATVTVSAPNQPPAARLAVTPTSGTAPLTVNASTAGSSDPDGAIASTSINFGDGTVVNAASGSHTYNSANTYTVTATVTDNGGRSSSATATVTVNPAGTLDCNASNFSFVNFSDDYMMGEGTGLDLGVLNRIYSLDPDIRMVIGEGDLQDLSDARSTVDAVLSNKRFCGEPEYPFFSTLGNHNYGSDDPSLPWWESTYGNNWSSNAAGSRLALQLPGVTNFRRGPLQTYQRIPNAAVYSFDFKNAHFVFLDDFEKFSPSNIPSGDDQFGPSDANGATVDPNSSQLDWLSQDLQATTSAWKFVFTHVGVVAHNYSSACSSWSEHNSVFNTAGLAQVLSANNVTAIYRGHDHCPSRALLDANRNVLFERSWNDTNSGLKGDPSLWTGLIGAGKFWQIDDGSVYNNNGFYTITAVTPSVVSFTTYTFTSASGNPVLWETFTIPLPGAPANQPPLANLSVTPTSGVAPLTVNASTAGSSDPDGSIAGTSINFGDGTVLNAASGSHTYATAGTYTVTATATDNGGLSDTATATVTVSSLANQPPTAQLSVTPASGTAPLTVNASTAGSSDPDGAIASTSINFGDGTVINAASGSHTYSSAGSYTVTATVTDNAGGSASKTATVTVNSSGGGAQLYVDSGLAQSSCTTYNPATRNCVGGTATAYKSVAGAEGAASAGYTILVRAATYSGPFSPAKNGTNNNPITWRAYNGESVTFSGGDPVLNLANRSWLVIDGFRVPANSASWLAGDNMTHVVVQNCTFTGPTGAFTAAHVQSATYSDFINNTFSNASGDDLTTFGSDYMRFINNTFTDAQHTLLAIKCSNYNVVRGNHFSNSIQKAMEMFDCDATQGGVPFTRTNQTQHNLIEGNFFTLTPVDNGDGPFSGIQYAGQYGMIRRNVFYNNKGMGIDFTIYGPDEATYTQHNRAYNNVFHANQSGVQTNHSGTSCAKNTSCDNVFKNNIFYQNTAMPQPRNDNNPSGKQLSHNDSSTGFLVTYNDIIGASAGEAGAIQVNWTNYTLAQAQSSFPSQYNNNLEVNPSFVNATNHDYHLNTGSPMIDAGTWLTTITSNTGSGTSFTVADATYFRDSFGIAGEVGDTIQLAGSATTAVITAIDYTTNTITVNQSLSWTKGQGVALQYNGSKPDAGAFEF